MGTTQTVVLIAHTFIAIMIIVLVLLQRGKGADAGAAFGAGSSGTVFGARGSGNFFSRATAVLAAAFFASSLVLAFLSSQGTDVPESLLEGAPAESAKQQPEPQPAEGGEAPPGELPGLEEDSGRPAGDEMPALREETPPEAEDDGPPGDERP